MISKQWTALLSKIAWHRIGGKPFSEPITSWFHFIGELTDERDETNDYYHWIILPTVIYNTVMPLQPNCILNIFYMTVIFWKNIPTALS